ncbi:MAG: MATE family efflux transporter [Bacteroidales bacterium]|nr:MATE family efflux transporter [Bacteroidales bacterium]
MLSNRELNKKIINLTIPNIITNITVPLLGMVDTAIVGHISDGGMQADYIGAIAIGSMIFNFIYWNFGFLRMGTSGFTAQAYGAKDKNEQIDILIRSVFIAISAAFILLCLQYPIAQLCSLVIEDRNNVMSFALQYFYIRIWAAPATLGMYALKGWFIGMQDSKTPMWISIMINVVNIVFDIFFVMHLGMKIDGVAYATVIAQYSGLLTTLFISFRKYNKTFSPSFSRAISMSKMKVFFKVNGDIFLRTVCIIAVTTYFTIASSKMEYPLLAVNTLIMQLFSLFSYFMDGFAYASESLCGRFSGAGDKQSLRRTVNLVILWGVVLAGLCMVVYGFFSQDILSLLTNQQDVIQTSRKYLLWTILIPLAGFLAFLFDGILIGMIKSVIMRNAMFVATASFFLIFFLGGQTNNALWLGFISYLFFRSVLMFSMSYKLIYSK